ncbi:MAG TPA: 50S ribosomal protein L11 methyltransferase [Gemmatimonadaceae bacterium]|nr:50S ribosomal protein L11 methyltransferase [Gemmatimonadaceae bacterium]
MSWHALRVTPGTEREAVIAALFASGAEGVHEDGALVVTHFPSDVAAHAAAAAVHRADPAARTEIALAADVDWSLAWRDRLGAYPLGSLTIVPPWMSGGRDPARTIVVEPGMAFGTGDHPSTRGAGRLLEHAMRTMRSGAVVADLGTGSAVLAVAAAKLGAQAIHAIEIDPEAFGNARHNIAANGVDDAVTLLEGDAGALLPVVAPLDLIVANIISSVLLPLLPVMRAALRPSGCAILAGLLAYERETVMAALASGGWRLVRDDLEEDWWSALIAPA